MVKKAVVLAAGLGTRLRPLTCTVPKPLMPVWGTPMLERIVTLLRSWGVDDIVVNCHHLHEQVEAWCQAHGCRASFEPEILGTGGVLNPLRTWIGTDDFYLVNGDIVVENAPQLTWGEKPDASVVGRCLVTEEGPRTVEVEPESRFVTNWKSEDAGFPGTFTYCGLALLKAEILAYVAPVGASSIVTAYEKAMMEGKFVQAVRPDKLLWTDAGTLTRYIDLNRAGDETAFADFPQLQAVQASAPVFLGARGSDRLFFREGERLIIFFDDAKRGENARYAGHARWLKQKGVSVPEVLVDWPEKKTLVLSWAGTERAMSFDDRVKAVEALVAFNALGDEAVREGVSLEPAFDAALFRWEHELFAEHCLGSRFGLPLASAVRAELEEGARRLLAEPRALVHRDFQSTNVLWKGDRLTFIDFQGMRLGPAAYDLASFVYDPYVTMTEKERDALVALYARQSGRGQALTDILPFAAVQRLVQCLGAYGRLSSVGQSQFSRYVLPALENLLAVADKAGLEAVGALAEELIAKETHRSHGASCACGCHS